MNLILNLKLLKLSNMDNIIITRHFIKNFDISYNKIKKKSINDISYNIEQYIKNNKNNINIDTKVLNYCKK